MLVVFFSFSIFLYLQFVYDFYNNNKCNYAMLGEVCDHLWLLYSGWGLRCLNDIPAGGFVCIYAGQLLNDEGANQVTSVLPLLVVVLFVH